MLPLPVLQVLDDETRNWETYSDNAAEPKPFRKLYYYRETVNTDA